MKAASTPFQLPELRFTRETAESMAINRIAGGAVIMAGSGMCTGGRIKHHLIQNIHRAESTVLFVGYADNRRGDELVDLTESNRTLFFKLGYAWLP